MNQPVPPENPSSGIEQHVENATLGGGIQAAQGDDNIQIQGDNNFLTFNQTKIIQISVDEIKTREFIPTSPYKGLKKFEPEDKDLFFGRDQFLTGLVNELEQTNLILLLGASGSGKSSVVRAGLIPWLSQKWGSRLFNLTFTPDVDPYESFYACLLRYYSQKSAQIAREVKTETLTQVVKALKQPEDYWLIFIDQFEELFTTSADWKREQFIASLVELSKNKQPTVKIVATMRADFLDRLSPYPQLVKATEKHRPMIAEMQPDELRLAIEQPAAHHGVVFETGLIEEITKDIQGQAGYLPLLQYTLDLLWETEVKTGSINDRTLNISTYRELGGVRGALQQRVDSIYADLSAAEKLAAQRIFLKLVGIGKDGESDSQWKPIRRRALKSEFSDQLEESVLVRLINENLLVSDRQLQSPESTVEIAHEILLTCWTTLNTWIKENCRAIALRNRLNDDVTRWYQRKVEDELWTGSKLEQVLELRGDPTFNQVLGGFSEKANEFIDASVGLRDRQRRRTIIGLTSFSVVVLILAMVAGLGWWRAFISEKNAKFIARSQSSKALFASNKQLDGLLESIRTGKQMKKELGGITANTEMQVVTTLMQSVYGVKERNRFEGYNQPFIRASFSSDGEKIAATNMEGSIKIWNLNGEEITTINQKKSGDIRNPSSGTGDCPINSVSFSPSSNSIAARDGDNIKLWDFNGRELKSFPGKGKDVTVTSISNDGKLIAAVSRDGKVKIWNQKGKEVHTFQHSNNFFPLSNPISFSPDNKIIASADGEESVVLWNLQTKRATPLKNQWTVCSIDFNSNSRVLAVVEYLSRVKFWSIEGKNQDRFEEAFGVTSVTYTSKGIAFTNWNGTITLSKWQEKSSLKGHSAPVWNVSFSPDENMLVSVSDDKTVKLWSLEGIKQPRFRPINGTFKDMSLSPDGQTIATFTPDDSIKLWNLNGTLRKKPFQKVSPFSKITFSPDGKNLVSSYRNLVQLWNIDSGESKTIIKQELTRHSRNFFGKASFSRDGKTIAVGREDGTIKLVLIDGTEKTFTKNGSKIVSFSPDGKLIASASSDNTVKLWRLNGEELKTLTGHTAAITSLSFSPDSKTIAAGSENGTIILWSITREKIKKLKGHTSDIWSLSFRPDGKIIASASGNIKLWNLEGQELITLTSDNPTFKNVNFSPDGKMLVSANQSEVIMWNLDLEHLLSKGCNWVRDYLQNNPNVSEKDRHLCDAPKGSR